MITVTNRIKVKKGFGEKLAPAFTSGKSLLDFEGFQKVQVLVSTQHDDYDEMQVMMYWDNHESFEVWRNSDAFKKAHNKNSGNAEESPVISNEIIIAKVASELTK